MTIAFHPENPPLIAGGTFNGSFFFAVFIALNKHCNKVHCYNNYHK